jgi:hypothetical protein
MLRRIPLLLAAMLASLNVAGATGEIESIITETDRDRLARFEEARERALEQAGNGGSETARAAFREILAAEPVPFSGVDLTGDWQCRTIKAGGPADLVIYGWFECRISDDGSGWRLEKLTGSQRTVGRFFTESDTRLTYLGSYFVAGDEPVAYGGPGESDQVGYATLIAPDHFKIEMPLPHRESIFDILELRR